MVFEESLMTRAQQGIIPVGRGAAGHPIPVGIGSLAWPPELDTAPAALVADCVPSCLERMAYHLSPTQWTYG